MRIVLLADHDFATRERSFLGRLEVALADEGIGVVHAAPSRAASAAPPPGLARRVEYADAESLFSAERRARRLRDAVAESADAAVDPPFDAVHVFGSAAWGLAGSLARLSNAGLVVEAFSVSQARRAGGAGLGRGSRPALFMTPDAALERVIRREFTNAATRVGLWGVHRPGERRTILAEDEAPSLVMAGSGEDRGAWLAAIEGLALAATEGSVPPFLVFADSDAARRADIWPAVQRLRLAGRVSLVAGIEANRDLALRADGLILPEAQGEHRSIVLDAMGAGMAVIAAADPFAGSLVHGRTAMLVAGPDASLWAAAVVAALRDPAATRRLGEAASAHVAQHHRVSGYAAAAIDGYEWLVRREATTVRAAEGPP